MPSAAGHRRRRPVALRALRGPAATNGSRRSSPFPASSRTLTTRSRRPTPSSRGSGIRECDLDALEALESELSVWKSAKTHEQELVDVVRIAIKLRKTDIDGVLEGFKSLSRDEVSDMYDPALVELSLEICTDAAGGVVPLGNRVDREGKLQEVQSQPGLAALPDRGAQGQSAAVAGRIEAYLSQRAGWESRSMAFLKRANGDTTGQIIELKPERVIIGRSPEHCHIVLDPNGVSRRHAEIYRKGEDFYLSDLNSRNMTRVNNAKVIPGIDHRLVTGDRINICDVEFLFYPQLPADGASKDAGEIMIVNEAENNEAPQLHVLDASRSSAMASMIKPEVKLKAILEITRNLSSELKIDAVAPKILDSLMELFPQAERLFLILVDPATKRLIRKAFKHRPAKKSLFTTQRPGR